MRVPHQVPILPVLIATAFLCISPISTTLAGRFDPGTRVITDMACETRASAIQIVLVQMQRGFRAAQSFAQTQPCGKADFIIEESTHVRRVELQEGPDLDIWRITATGGKTYWLFVPDVQTSA